MDRKGIDYLLDCCEELGINGKEVFYTGTGGTYSKNGANGERFVFKTSKLKKLSSQKYVIKYFSDHKFYICWNLMYNKESKEVFSASKYNVDSILASNQKSFDKSTEYSGWGTEPVCVIRCNEVKEFLESIKEKL